MEIAELRIGNLVEYKLMECDIFEIKAKTISVTAANYAEDFEDKIEAFNPIPLTGHLLLRFGFEQSSIIVNEYSIGWFTVQLSGAVIFRCYDGCLDKKVFKYAHELQNFYYIVTGKELIH